MLFDNADKIIKEFEIVTKSHIVPTNKKRLFVGVDL